MKKIILLIFLFIFIYSIGAQLSPYEDTNIRVAIDGEAPIIILIDPKNVSYNNETPLLVNYTVIDSTLNTVWYSLNNQENITVNSFFYLSLPEKIYFLTIYANDSLNRINSSSITFKINNSVSLCNNNICDANELCSTCPQDCGICPITPSSSSSSGGGGGGGIPTFSKNSTNENNNQNALYERPKTQEEILNEIIINKTTKENSNEKAKLNIIVWPIMTITILFSLIIVMIYLKQHKKNKQKITLKKTNGHLTKPKAY